MTGDKTWITRETTLSWVAVTYALYWSEAARASKACRLSHFSSITSLILFVSHKIGDSRVERGDGTQSGCRAVPYDRSSSLFLLKE
jgi:hypothetical protein